jgi:type IV pilus assembly protein PilA
MSAWYYVDRGHNRQGPVDDAGLTDAIRQGQLDDASLVWRDGMAQWSPLGQFRAELGLGAAPAMAPPAPPPAPAKSRSGCAVAAIVIIGGGIFLIAILGILAAIALPAYQDYVVRAKVAAVLLEGEAAKEQVSTFIANTDRCPRDAAELQLGPPSSPGLAALEVVPLGGGVCVIELTLGAVPGAEDLAEGRIFLRREQDGTWSCSSDLARQNRLPATCR